MISYDAVASVVQKNVIITSHQKDENTINSMPFLLFSDAFFEAISVRIYSLLRGPQLKTVY